MTPNQATVTLRDLIDELEIARRHSIELIAGLSADQIAWRPHDDSSAIGWHLGHQAAVGHFMVRNLISAEPTFSREFDLLFDSATPEPSRGSLPPLAAILDYRQAVEKTTTATIERVVNRQVSAADQLAAVADGLLRALINHEYQHSTWIHEVRDTMIDEAAPTPASTRITSINGYWMMPQPTAPHSLATGKSRDSAS